MRALGLPEILVILIVIVLLLGRKFRGGPPPIHPLPADDSRILNRKRRPSSQDV